MNSIIMNNPVGKLQERFQSKCEALPVYTDIFSSGPSHSPLFKMQVAVSGKTAVGEGSTKKQAKTEAAKAMLLLLDGIQQESRAQSPTSSESSFSSTSTFTAGASSVTNTVGQLQEYCVANKLQTPTYDLEKQVGSSHSPTFTITCTIGNSTTTGTASSKKTAKTLSAANMLQQLQGVGTSSNPGFGSSIVDKKDDQSFEDEVSSASNDSPASNCSVTSNGTYSERFGHRQAHQKDETVRPGDGSVRVKVLKPQNKAEINNFISNLNNSGRESKLKNLHRMNLSKALGKCKNIMNDISTEQGFSVTYVGLDEKSQHGEVQCLVQISTMPVFVAMGAGIDQELAENAAALCALTYLKMVTDAGQN